MSRPGRGLSATFFPALAFALATAALTTAACQADVGDANCQLKQQIVLVGAPSSPLLLLPGARLDQVGDGFWLIGSDAAAVRWAALAADGTLSAEQAFELPAGATNPVYAVAGLETPGDTVLIGYLTTGSDGTSGVLEVVAVAADGTQAPTAPSAVLTFAAGVPAASTVTMLSSRVGMNAGLAWVDSPSPSSHQVLFTTVSGAAQLVGQPISVAASTTMNAATALSCLHFSPGNDNLTLTFLDQTSDGSAPPTYVIAEANEGGSVDTTTTLSVASQMENCAIVTPTGTGYALVWQDITGSWLAVSAKVGASIQVGTYPFASASSFGGPNLQPPLVGLAPFGTDFGVVLARAADVEMWRLDAMGNRRAGSLVFPTLAGNLGGVSALPVGGADPGSLVATYADYTSAPDATTLVGRRMFVDAVCY
jgi:hypothetical protein